jgi:subtilisin family serine protease
MGTVFTSLRRSHAIGPVAAACLAAGCAPAAAHREASTSVSAAGVSVATAYVETRTLSFALDRIDQHEFPLDRLYRHFGTGRGVTVYVFDGGVLDTHPELAGRVRHGYDAFRGDGHPCNAHGTAVAGAVAGTTLGVAPEAEVVDVKMVECGRLRGTIDAIVRGTRWVLQDHARRPGRRAVANWSFIADTTGAVPALDTAIRELMAAGIPVVVAAGNVEMDACRIAPGNAPGAIVVGASRVRRKLSPGDGLVDERAPGTAYGPCITVFAPGDPVLLPSIDSDRHAGSQLWTGTSMAAGYVSGAVALFLEAHPHATPEAAGAAITARARATLVDTARSPRAGMLYVGTGK